MKVAVLSLARDRVAYTQHCFASLEKYAGCDFDHYVWDNGSTDDTPRWLEDVFVSSPIVYVGRSPRNLGIHAAMNRLLDAATGPDSDVPYAYDVVVKVDNDCELIHHGTLRAVAEIQHQHPGSMVGPVVNGLRGPMPLGRTEVVEVEREFDFSHFGDGPPGSIALVRLKVAVTPMIGGIMQPIPPGWRYDETMAPWGGDDGVLSAQADWCGQLLDYPVNHYRTTDGQHDDYPDYFAQRVAAGGPA